MAIEADLTTAAYEVSGPAQISIESAYRSTGDEKLSTAVENNQSAAEDVTAMIHIPLADLLVEIWQRRRWLAMVTGLGLLLATAYALLIPNEYESTAELMPLDQQSISSVSMLSALAGNIAPGMAASLMSGRTPGNTAIGILNSRIAQDDIINQFDLLRVYHCKFYVDARKTLASRSTFEENKITGIISITVMDHDRYRARAVAEAYVEELNKLINKESTSASSRERIFLEERLRSIKSDLDASSLKLSQFSSRNATLNLQSQSQAIIESAGRLQGELITAQSELYGLKAQYSDDNVRVREARARVDELQSQLHKMGGMGKKEDGSDLATDQLYPSIRELPILGATYTDLYRQMIMQENIYETLTRQYELSKVQEAKEIPVIKILDEPELPERKSSPHRSIVVMLGALASIFVGVSWIICCKLWGIADSAHPAKAFGIKLLYSIQGHNAATPN